MNLLTGKIVSCCKVISIKTTQEFIDVVEYLAKKDDNKSPLYFKYCKERTIF